MNTRLLSFVVTMSLVFVPATTGVAHPKAQDHYLELELVLFGKKYAGPSKEALTLLEYASTLAIDQYKGSDADKLAKLAGAGIPGLPPNVTDAKEQNEKGINYTASPNTHREATHRGWDWYYQPSDKSNWPARKNILLSTANKVFAFSLVSGQYDRQCNSLCALIYYVHLIGDHQEDSKYKSDGAITSLAEKNYNASNIDIFYELEKHLPILFANQRDSWTYMRMMSKLGVLGKEVRKLTGSREGVTPEKTSQYHEYARELIGILSTYVPSLLKQEKFFSNAF